MSVRILGSRKNGFSGDFPVLANENSIYLSKILSYSATLPQCSLRAGINEFGYYINLRQKLFSQTNQFQFRTDSMK